MQGVRRVLGSVLVLASAGAAACASTGGPATGGGDSNRLTSEEIQAAGLPNAYEMVNRMRRAWLRADPLTGGAVAVYMDDRNLGGAEALREIPAARVAALELVAHDEAAMRWTPSPAGRVIVVVPRR